MNKSYFLVFEKSENQIGFAYTTGFIGSDNKEEALNLIADNLNDYAKSGGTWAASAAIDYISCRQHIVEIEGGFETIKEMIGEKEGKAIRTNYGGFAGSRPVLQVLPEYAAQLRSSIIKSLKLLDEETFESTKPYV